MLLAAAPSVCSVWRHSAVYIPTRAFLPRIVNAFPERRRMTRCLGPGLHMDLLKAARDPHALNALHLGVLLVAPPNLLVRVSAVAAAEEGRVAEDAVHVLILQPHDTGVAVHCTEDINQGPVAQASQHQRAVTRHVRPLSCARPPEKEYSSLMLCITRQTWRNRILAQTMH